MGRITKQTSQALARGYCSKRNEHKVLDPDLIADMAFEIEKWILEKKPKRKRHSITETSYDEEYIDAYNQAISDYLKAMEGE